LANIGYLPRQNIAGREAVSGDTLVRSLLLVAVFLLLWLSFRPLSDLSEAPEVTASGNLVNQLGYSLLFVVIAAWCLRHHPERLLLLIRPILVVTLLWMALCVVTSWEPSISARRFAFTLVTTGIAAMVLLLPKNPRHFGDVLAGTALFVIVVCYLGVMFAPSLSVHQATDYLEPELAGDWRGVFTHKNEASATMVLFVFIGLFVARLRSLALGGAIVVLALPFLYFTHSKTAIAALPLVLIVSWVMARVRRPAIGIGLALSGLIFFNLISVGSLYLEPIRNLTDRLLSDPTFTGRTEVWEFALQRVAEHPLLGYGFAAFWGTPEVVYGMAANAVWANTAGHAHNGFIDLALTIGIPGSALVALWLVVLPLVDYYRGPRDASTELLKMLFLRVCLFAAYESCFENMLIEAGALGTLVVMATFGMRYLSVSRISR
jgi:O-antigen ligase